MDNDEPYENSGLVVLPIQQPFSIAENINQLNGLRLDELFRRVVLGWDELPGLAEVACQKNPLCCSITEKLMGFSHNELWPARYEDYDHLWDTHKPAYMLLEGVHLKPPDENWENASYQSWDPITEIEPNVRRFFEILSLATVKLLKLLRSGEIVCSGFDKDFQNRTSIEADVWNMPEVWINFNECTLFVWRRGSEQQIIRRGVKVEAIALGRGGAEKEAGNDGIIPESIEFDDEDLEAMYLKGKNLHESRQASQERNKPEWIYNRNGRKLIADHLIELREEGVEKSTIDETDYPEMFFKRVPSAVGRVGKSSIAKYFRETNIE